MNIGMILDETFPPDPRVENEAHVLLDQGHKVFLLCIDYSGNQPAEELIRGIQVQRIQYPRLVYKLSALAYSIPVYHLIFLRAIKRFIRINTIEVLHVHDLQVARAAFMANRSLALPLFLDLHENRPEIMKHYKHLQNFPGKLLIFPKRWKKMETRYIQKSYKTIVVTEEARDYYLKTLHVNSEKFVVVPNTVKRNFYEEYTLQEELLHRYKDQYMILYIGDTGERRGLETLMQAVYNLKEQIPALKLCILGKSSNDTQLRMLADRLSINESVDFEGWQPPERFQSYILASKICACPILRNIHHDTTYANKLFQYAALGRPLLVSDCTAQKNLVEKHDMGRVFKAGNSVDCAAKILEFWKLPDQTREQGEHGKLVVQKLMGWEIVSEDLAKAYLTLPSA